MKKRVLAKGVEISNDTRLTGLNNNDMVIGPSGSGKTGGYVIPNIQNNEGSLVVSDTKGRLSELFTDELKSKGYEVYTLDFVNPRKSCVYNPLNGVRRYKNGKYREQDVLTLANTIMPCLDSREPFWEKAAAGYIAMLIAFCLEALPKKEQTMASVCKLNRSYTKPGGDLSFIDYFKHNPDSFAARKYYAMKSSCNADKMWASINEFANRALEPFEFGEAYRIFGKQKGFDIRSLGRKKTVLFLNVSDTDRTFDQLVNIFHTQALQLLCNEADENEGGRLKVPVRIIMDDFATSARIPDFDKVISVIRSREISVSLILQSLTQLDSMYDHPAATTIMNNCDHVVFLGSQDQETANYIGFRACKTPETILCMPDEQVIVITKGRKAQFVDKLKPYSTMPKEMQQEMG